jgi:hypothetical protein
MWLRPEEEPLERPRRTIQDPKIMVTIAWNPLGFHLLNALPKGRSFTMGYHHDNICAGLVLLRLAEEERQLVLHADNAMVHTAQKYRDFCRENSLQILAHLTSLILHSPTLPCSDMSNSLSQE